MPDEDLAALASEAFFYGYPLVTAIRPARRAARLPVLRAIAAE